MHNYTWDFNIPLTVTISLKEVSKTIYQMDLIDTLSNNKIHAFQEDIGHSPR